jgi:purine-binding chemotaxis protein CheW
VRAVLLPVTGEWWALAVTNVREVVAAPQATPLPAAPEGVLGVFNLRGEIVPLFDTGRLLNIGPCGERPPFAVVFDTAAGPGALATSAVPETHELTVTIPTDERSRRTWRLGDRLVTQLDAEAIVTGTAQAAPPPHPAQAAQVTTADTP